MAKLVCELSIYFLYLRDCVGIFEGSIKSSPWTSSRYIDLNCPLSPCVSLQWTIRDSCVVNLPCTLLVEGDVILLRPGQIVCVKCRRLKVRLSYCTKDLFMHTVCKGQNCERQ